MKIAILALQGAFAEHQQMLQRLGVESVEIRNFNDWQQYLSEPATKKGLIIPGGESTTMMRIMKDEELLVPVQDAIRQGLPVFGTCAGLILLDDKHLNVMDISVLRNAYGRQLGSFFTEYEMKGLGQIPMTFIRAPYIERVGPQVEVLSVLEDHIIAARQDNMLVTAFHPELNEDTRVHQYFIDLISSSRIPS